MRVEATLGPPHKPSREENGRAARPKDQRIIAVTVLVENAAIQFDLGGRDVR